MLHLMRVRTNTSVVGFSSLKHITRWEYQHASNTVRGSVSLQQQQQRQQFSQTTFKRSSVRLSHLTSKELDSITVEPARLWQAIHSTAQWGQAYRYGDAPEETGLSRLSLSDMDKQARDWFVDTTKGLGCQVTVDAMGNTFAIRPGRAPSNAPATFVGSHLDSQPMGGRFDGVLGVCAGVEMLRVLNDRHIETEGPVGVVNWTNEEGARFPVSMMGSGVWAGARGLDETYALEEVVASGNDGARRNVRHELERIGYKGQTDADWECGVPMGAHFELHIEQGPYLEKGNQKIGAVEGVQAYKWFEVVVQGQSAHTGATGYEYRADALYWASRIILEVRDIAQKLEGLASVGVIKSEPQSVNTVPHKVMFSLDVRHKSDQKMTEIASQIEQFLPEVEGMSRLQGSDGVSISLKETFCSWATVFDVDAVNSVKSSAKALLGGDGDKNPARNMVSGAGHDSVHTQKRCPTAMIFIPCRNGISHNPKEWSTEEDCAIGASVLLQSVLRFDLLRHKKGHFD